MDSMGGGGTGKLGVRNRSSRNNKKEKVRAIECPAK